jgi:hypothetical protein
LKYAHGVIRAQNSNGTGETDPFGPDRRCGQDRLRRRIKKLRPVMLANPKDIQANAIRRLDFVEEVAQAICRAETLTRQGVRYRGYKTIDSELHNPAPIILQKVAMKLFRAATLQTTAPEP